MTLLAPLFLLALLPWLGLALYLLWGRRRRVDVPFIELWKANVPPPQARRSLEPPPLFLAAAILAILLAILAAARPAIRAGSPAGPVTILIDRGITLSNPERYRALVTRAAAAVEQSLGPGAVEILTIPAMAPIEADRANWTAAALVLPPTAIDTSAQLRATIAQHLAGSTRPLLVLTDQPIDTTDRRIIRLGPPEGLKNIALVSLAFRSGQAMVRIHNESDHSSASLRLHADDRVVSITPIDLPPGNESRNYFLDLPESARILSAELVVDDDIAADNRLWSVAPAHPRLSVVPPLPEVVERLVADYSRLRPASEHSPEVLVTASLDDLPLNKPAIAILRPRGDQGGRGDQGEPAASAGISVPVSIRQHPITASAADYPPPATPLPGGGGEAGGGISPDWQPLVTRGETPLVWARDSLARQVLVNADLERWATLPDFVVFFADAFEWAGGMDQPRSATAGNVPSALTPIDDSPATPGHWPGLHRSPSGPLVAVNPPPPPATIADATDWPEVLSELARDHPIVTAHVSLTPPLLLASLALLLLAAARWRVISRVRT